MTNKYPGINQTTFYLKLNKGDFIKGQLIINGQIEAKIIKVYRVTWWKKLFKFFGFRTRINQIKLKPL